MNTTTPDIQNEIIQFVSEITGTPASDLMASSSVETVDTWDSVAHINIILSVEAKYGITINPEDAIELTSVGALENFVSVRQE